jgi:hypothetical protein
MKENRKGLSMKKEEHRGNSYSDEKEKKKTWG